MKPDPPVRVRESDSRTVRQLAADERRLKIILDSTLDGIVIINTEGIIETFNKACEQIFGYGAEEILGQNIKRLMPPRYSDHHDHYLQDYKKTRQTTIIGTPREVEGQRKDGSVFPLEISVAEINLENEVVYVGVLRDITVRRTAERAIKDAQKFNDLIFETIPDYLFVKDQDYRIIKANSNFINIYPASMRDNIIGHTTVENYRKKDADAFLAHDKKALELGMSEVEETLDFPDGLRRTLLTKKVRFEDQDGSPYILGLARDISAIKEYEARLLRSNEALDEFAYIASHDLKEPLRGIHNHARFLIEDCYDQLDEDSKHKLDRIMKLSQRMERLISDLLYYSRLGRDQENSHQNVDVQAIVDDIRDTLSDRDDTDIVTVTAFPVVCGNPTRLTELFRNLVENGIKYNDSQKKRIEIGVKPDNLSSGTIFFVRDNGIGIDPQFYGDIFKMFKRLHKKTAYGGGTGSGLTFVKKIVEQHGGRIWVESAPGHGTTFFFTLPGPRRDQ